MKEMISFKDSFTFKVFFATLLQCVIIHYLRKKKIQVVIKLIIQTGITNRQDISLSPNKMINQ